MSFKILAVRTGQPDPGRLRLRGEEHATTFGRATRTEPVRVLREGIQGDRVADPRVHGGAERAVLFYAYSNYEFWSSKLGVPLQEAFERGFGENITIDGVDERGMCVGDRLQIGEVVLEVNQPRSPCWKIGAYWAAATLTKEVYRTGKTGWFARVVQEGMLDVSQPVELRERPYPGLTIQALNDAIVQIERHGGDPGAFGALCAAARDCEALPPNWRNVFGHAHERSA